MADARQWTSLVVHAPPGTHQNVGAGAACAGESSALAFTRLLSAIERPPATAPRIVQLDIKHSARPINATRTLRSPHFMFASGAVWTARKP